jgi:hypothetical protein
MPHRRPVRPPPSAAHRPARAVVALAVLATVAGCDRTTAPGDSPGLGLAPDTARLAWGDTLRLRADWAGAGASVAWSTSDTTVLRVDPTGLVVALRAGAGRVTARAGERVGSRDLAVDARFTALSAGYDSSCGVVPAERLLCWGRIVDSAGPGTGRAYRVHPGAMPALGETRVRDVAVVRGRTPSVANPGSVTCATRAAASPLCWGLASQGEQGTGSLQRNVVHPPTPVGGPAVLASVALGYAHACGLTAAGAAYCWGNAAEARLGHPTTSTACLGVGSVQSFCQTLPAPVSGADRYRVVAVGGAHGCGVTLDGRLLCWGTGPAAGAPPPVFNQERPVFVPTMLGSAATGSDAYATVAAGFDHACAITTGGELRCWGLNGSGQLGRGTRDTLRYAAPGAVAGAAGGAAQPVRYRAVSAGTAFTCAVAADGRLSCWGANDWGQLGDGTTAARALPTPVATTRRFVAVSAGDTHACAIADDGAGYCWGDNRSGQLGNGVTTSSSVPVRVGAPR